MSKKTCCGQEFASLADLAAHTLAEHGQAMRKWVAEQDATPADDATDGKDGKDG